jgi:hypothetical protein
MPLPSLEKVLEYTNVPVLKLYEQNYPKNKLGAEDAFRETLKYLWLAKKHEQDVMKHKNNEEFPNECFMPRSMREIDEMWHEFILFTEDYTNFCHQYFGEYIHHFPNIFDNIPRPREEVEMDTKKLLLYIYDNLGEDTVRIWFSSYLNENSQ